MLDNLSSSYFYISMGKKRNRTCLYCGQVADTKDHTPPKNLLEKPFPENLITVPACLKCNRSLSLDEEYFLNVLVELATSKSLLLKLEPEGSVFKARIRSPRLNTLIKNSLVTGDDGRTYIQPDIKRIKRVSEKIAIGLYYQTYKKRVKTTEVNFQGIYTFNIIEERPPEVILLTYTEHFFPKKWTTIQKDIFSYIIVRDWRKSSLTMIMQLHNTLWCVLDIPIPRGYRKPSKNQLSLFGQNYS